VKVLLGWMKKLKKFQQMPFALGEARYQLALLLEAGVCMRLVEIVRRLVDVVLVQPVHLWLVV